MRFFAITSEMRRLSASALRMLSRYSCRPASLFAKPGLGAPLTDRPSSVRTSEVPGSAGKRAALSKSRPLLLISDRVSPPDSGREKGAE